jgi:hypothetical protein
MIRSGCREVAQLHVQAVGGGEETCHQKRMQEIGIANLLPVGGARHLSSVVYAGKWGFWKWHSYTYFLLSEKGEFIIRCKYGEVSWLYLLPVEQEGEIAIRMYAQKCTATLTSCCGGGMYPSE